MQNNQEAPDPSESQGPLARVLMGLGRWLGTRGELALFEWERERERLLTVFAQLFGSAIFAAFSVAFVGFALMLAVPDAWRFLVALVWAGLMGVLGWRLYAEAQRALGEPAFRILRKEIEKDQQAFGAAFARGESVPSSAEASYTTGTDFDEDRYEPPRY